MSDSRLRRALLLAALALFGAWACSANDAAPLAPDGDAEAAESEREAENADEAPACSPTTVARDIPEEADTTFDLGPYLMHTTKTSVVVMWRSLSAEDGTVFFGEGEALDRHVAQEGKSVIHEITLRGLSADTRYAYKVVSGGLESKPHHFRSAPGDEASLRFSVMSDTHGVLEVFEPLLKQVRAFGPALFLHAGDAIHDGSLPETYKPNFYDPIRAIGHEIPLYLTIGNHEAEAQTWYDLVSYPPPAYDDGKHPHEYESAYGFRYGNTYFLVVNTNLIFFPITETMDTTLSKHLKTLMASPEAQSATWRVAIGHESGYAEDWGSCYNADGTVRYDGNEYVRKWLLPTLAAHHFHAYLSGDVHSYQRGKTEGGVFLFTVGGGGGGLDRWCRDWPEIQVARETHHYLQVEAGCEELSFKAIDRENAVLDFVTLDRAHYGTAKDSGPEDPPRTDIPPERRRPRY